MIAHTLKQSIRRAADEAARYGGEEFVIILPNTPLAGAQHMAEQIRQNIQALQIPHKSSKTSDWATLSLGVASCIPKQNCSPDELIEVADRALYVAKQNGRNQWASQEI